MKKVFGKHFNLIMGIAVILLFFSSCTSLKNKSSLRPVYITNTKKINLLEPQYTERNVDEVQLLNGSFGDTSFSLLSYTEINETGINLALFNDFGTDMGNLSYDGATVIFDSAYFPSNLPGEYIAADIQNAFYDETALRANYESAKLGFESEASVNEKSEPIQLRRIYDGKNLIEEITITPNEVTVKNHLRGYSYSLICSQ